MPATVVISAARLVTYGKRCQDRVQYLSQLPKLGTLWLMRTKVTDGAADYLGKMKSLGRLGLDDTQITDATLQRLEGLPNLRTIGIRRTKVTDAGVKGFQAALPKVKVVTK